MKKTVLTAEESRREKFRELMKDRRKQLEFTQQQVADAVNVSVDSIRAMENGRSTNPSFFLAADILTFLGIELGEAKKWSSNS